MTANLEGAPIDDALRITDAETMHFVYRLLREEGLLLGSTAGINVAAAVTLAKQMGRGHTIVTVLCDGGAKYQSRLFNKAWIAERGFAEAIGLTARPTAKLRSAASGLNHASESCKDTTSPTTKSVGDSRRARAAASAIVASVAVMTRWFSSVPCAIRAAGSVLGGAMPHELRRDMPHARKSHIEHRGDSGLDQRLIIGLASIAVLMPRDET